MPRLVRERGEGQGFWDDSIFSERHKIETRKSKEGQKFHRMKSFKHEPSYSIKYLKLI